MQTALSSLPLSEENFARLRDELHLTRQRLAEVMQQRSQAETLASKARWEADRLRSQLSDGRKRCFVCLAELAPPPAIFPMARWETLKRLVRVMWTGEREVPTTWATWLPHVAEVAGVAGETSWEVVICELRALRSARDDWQARAEKSEALVRRYEGLEANDGSHDA